MYGKGHKFDCDTMLQARKTNYIIISKKNIVKWEKKRKKVKKDLEI